MFNPSNPHWRIGHVDSRVDPDALEKLDNLLSKQGLGKVELQEHCSAVSGLRPFRDQIDIDAVSRTPPGTKYVLPAALAMPNPTRLRSIQCAPTSMLA